MHLCLQLQLKNGVKRVCSTRKAKCSGLRQNDLTWLPKYPFVTPSKCVLYKTEDKTDKIDDKNACQREHVQVCENVEMLSRIWGS